MKYFHTYRHADLYIQNKSSNPFFILPWLKILFCFQYSGKYCFITYYILQNCNKNVEVLILKITFNYGYLFFLLESNAKLNLGVTSNKQRIKRSRDGSY